MGLCLLNVDDLKCLNFKVWFQFLIENATSVAFEKKKNVFTARYIK